MNKKTKTILAVALVGGVGYYMWMKSKSSPKVNAAGSCKVNVGWKNRKLAMGKLVTIDGETFCQSGNMIGKAL
jgi:hypothetical protein